MPTKPSRRYLPPIAAVAGSAMSMIVNPLDAMDAARRARAQVAKELAAHLKEAADLGLHRDVLRLLLHLRRLSKEEARREIRTLLEAGADLAILARVDLDDMIECLGLTIGEIPAPPDEPEPARPNGHAQMEAQP